MRIGIIGCGGIAHAHAKAYQKTGHTVCACFDVAEATAKEFAQTYQAQRYSSVDELLQAVDAVSICTPPAFHADAVTAALANNIHVLCEKPIAASIEDAHRICAAAELSQAQCMLAFRHRFLPAIQKLKSLMEEGCIGTPIWFKNTFCAPAFSMVDRWFSQRAISGGGTLMDTSIHSVDLFRYLFGDIIDFQSVHHQHLAETDVEDCSILQIKSQSGVLGTCLAAWVAGHSDCSIEVMGQKGSLTYTYSDKLVLKTAETVKDIKVEESDGFTEEVEHFIASIKQGQAVTVNQDDGLAALNCVLLEGVYS